MNKVYGNIVKWGQGSKFAPYVAHVFTDVSKACALYIPFYTIMSDV